MGKYTVWNHGRTNRESNYQAAGLRGKRGIWGWKGVRPSSKGVCVPSLVAQDNVWMDEMTK